MGLSKKILISLIALWIVSSPAHASKEDIARQLYRAVEAQTNMQGVIDTIERIEKKEAETPGGGFWCNDVQVTIHAECSYFQVGLSVQDPEDLVLLKEFMKKELAITGQKINQLKKELD